MHDPSKTYQELIEENASLKQRIKELEKSEAESKKAGEDLQKSEEKYRLLADKIPDIVFILNLDLQTTYVSPSVQTVLGFSQEERMQQTVNQQLTPASLSIVFDTFARELVLEEEGQIDPQRKITLELEFYHKDGSTRWTETIISAIRDDKRVLTAIHGVNRDITARKHAEEYLRQSEENYRSIFENAQEGIYRTTPEGRFTMANHAMARILGYDSPEELMDSMTDITHQLYVNPEERIKVIEQIRLHGFAKDVELQFYRKDGRTIWVYRTMRGIRDEKGQLLYYEGIVEDITDRKNSVHQLRKALGGTILAIASLVETRDPYTAGHQRRVADMSRAIATEMQLSNDQIDGLRMAGKIHDIGKVSVPAEILSMPKKLTDIEFSLIKAHAQSGYDILKDIEFPWPIAKIILEHHERMDGSGYPNGLTGDNLLIESRIMAVADVVASMASHRPYRPSLGLDAALDEITKCRGVLYDSEVVDACLHIFNEKGYKIID